MRVLCDSPQKKRVLGGESIITFVKRIVKSKGADENSEGDFSQKAIGDLGGESIITFVKRNVKSKGADENAEDGFSQKVAGTLGIESIITVAKRIVIFRE